MLCQHAITNTHLHIIVHTKKQTCLKKCIYSYSICCFNLVFTEKHFHGRFPWTPIGPASPAKTREPQALHSRRRRCHRRRFLTQTIALYKRGAHQTRSLHSYVNWIDFRQRRTDSIDACRFRPSVFDTSTLYSSKSPRWRLNSVRNLCIRFIFVFRIWPLRAFCWPNT